MLSPGCLGYISLTRLNGSPSLHLDPQIRDWVLFPITLVMVCHAQ